jgi:excisionase family DNA binding protein
LRDELQFALVLARELPAHQLPRLLGELSEIRYTAIARLNASAQAPSGESDQLLSIDEASTRLHISKDYLYRHSKELPYARRIGRKLLFSTLEIDKYIRQQNGLTARRQRVTLMAS